MFDDEKRSNCTDANRSGRDTRLRWLVRLLGRNSLLRIIIFPTNTGTRLESSARLAARSRTCISESDNVILQTARIPPWHWRQHPTWQGELHDGGALAPVASAASPDT